MNVTTQPPPNPAPSVPRRAVSVPPWTWWIVGVVLAGAGGFFLFFWRGQLTVTVTPPSADLSVGDHQGVGSVEVSLWPGNYPVQARADGYVPYAEEIRVGQGERRDLSLELRPRPEATVLGDQPIQFLTFDPERTSLLYLVPGERIVERMSLKALANPVTDAITPDRFGAITSWLWSPDRQLAFYRENGTLRQYDFNRYDLVNQTVSDWPAEVISIDWRPDGEKVAYAYHNPTTGERTLIRAGKHNDAPERIFNFASMAITEPTIRWSPDGKTIAVLEKNLFLLDVFTAELRPLNLEESTTAITWSPTSDRLLFETEAGQLGLVRTDGMRESLQLRGPINRAVFTGDGSALVVARGRGLNLELARIDLATGQEATYAWKPSADEDPIDLLLGPDEDQLFFTSGGRLYALPLDDGSYPAP